MDFLSKPEREFLEWLENQDKPVQIDALMSAPYYRDARRQSLVERDLISATPAGLSGAEYEITDKGRSALEETTLTLDSDRRSKIALAVSIIASLVSVAAFVRSFFT